jgi:hypothetical protein
MAGGSDLKPQNPADAPKLRHVSNSVLTRMGLIKGTSSDSSDQASEQQSESPYRCIDLDDQQEKLVTTSIPDFGPTVITRFVGGDRCLTAKLCLANFLELLQLLAQLLQLFCLEEFYKAIQGMLNNICCLQMSDGAMASYILCLALCLQLASITNALTKFLDNALTPSLHLRYIVRSK